MGTFVPANFADFWRPFVSLSLKLSEMFTYKINIVFKKSDL